MQISYTREAKHLSDGSVLRVEYAGLNDRYYITLYTGARSRQIGPGWLSDELDQCMAFFRSVAADLEARHA